MRNRKRSRKLDGIGVRRIRRVSFSSDSTSTSVACILPIHTRSELSCDSNPTYDSASVASVASVNQPLAKIFTILFLHFLHAALALIEKACCIEGNVDKHGLFCLICCMKQTKISIAPSIILNQIIIIGFTFRNKVIRNKPIRSFLFFSTGQMDCVWRNHSYLYNNVPCSEVLNMISTMEKAIIWFKILLMKKILIV